MPLFGKMASEEAENHLSYLCISKVLSAIVSEAGEFGLSRSFMSANTYMYYFKSCAQKDENQPFSSQHIPPPFSLSYKGILQRRVFPSQNVAALLLSTKDKGCC